MIISAFGIKLLPLLPEPWTRQAAFNLLLAASVLFLLYAVPSMPNVKATSPPDSPAIVASTSGTSGKRHAHRSKDGQPIGKGIGSDTYYELISEEASHLARHPFA